MIRAPSSPGEIRLWGGETGAVYLGPQPKAGVFPEVLPNLQPGFAARGMTVPPGPQKGAGFQPEGPGGPEAWVWLRICCGPAVWLESLVRTGKRAQGLTRGAWTPPPAPPSLRPGGQP